MLKPWLVSAAIAAGSLGSLPAAALAAQPGVTVPAEKPADAEALLAALETADAGIDTFTATLDYSKFYAIQSDVQQRVGQLYYRANRADAASPADEPGARRQFAVTFHELRVGGRREQIDQHYAFDGEWVVEKTEQDRQFTKRQVVPPGESFDPLKIGEGPFPVPIGQKKADILERFDAELVDATEGLDNAALRDFAEAMGLLSLRLTPKAGSPQADDFETVQIWYEPDGRMLPRIARTVTPVGDEALVVLLNPVINETIAADLFSTATPPAEEGWNVHISEYRRSSAD